VPGLSSRGIFLSYRREDAAPYARLLQFQLAERFPDAQVFIDLDSIEAGLPFAEVIGDAVDSCAVLVALIGRQWVTLADEQGRRRLDNPDDFVRFEIQAALETSVRVIPVLVDGARALRQQELPSALQRLAELNALELSYGRYEYDARRLLDLIQRVLAADRGLVEAERQAPASAERQAPEEAELGVLEGRAHSAGQAGDAAEARDQYAAPLPIQERVLGPEHPATLATRHNLAAFTWEAGDAAGARDQCAALFSIEERVLGPEHPATLDTRASLARWVGEAGDAAGARDQCAALLPIQERVQGPEHPDTLTTRANLASWTGRAGDVAGARDQYATLLPIQERVQGPGHPDTLATRDNLAYWTGQAEDESPGQ
jgi:hypothetical protein